METRRASLSAVLIRGLLVGLLAGLVAFGVGYLVGEPTIDAAIAVEESAGHEHAPAGDEAAGHEAGGHEAGGHDAGAVEVVPRSLQSTLGLLTGTLIAGVTLGGLLALVCAATLGRLPRVGVRGTVLGVVAAGFVAGYVVPFLLQPPNPPGVGQSETIGARTAVWFAGLAISLVAAVVAALVGRRFAARWGGWYAGLLAGAGYLVAVLVAGGLLPRFHEVPAGYPAELLADFRGAALLTQLALWATLGIGLAEALHRLLTPASHRDPVAVGR